MTPLSKPWLRAQQGSASGHRLSTSRSRVSTHDDHNPRSRAEYIRNPTVRPVCGHSKGVTSPRHSGGACGGLPHPGHTPLSGLKASSDLAPPGGVVVGVVDVVVLRSIIFFHAASACVFYGPTRLDLHASQPAYGCCSRSGPTAGQLILRHFDTISQKKSDTRVLQAL